MKPRYLRMLAAMAGGPAVSGPAEWSVYMVSCADGSLYTGITNDLAERVRKHNAGTGAAYTRTRRPVRVVYEERRLTRSEALIREAAIKRLPRGAKEGLVRSPAPAAGRRSAPAGARAPRRAKAKSST